MQYHNRIPIRLSLQPQQPQQLRMILQVPHRCLNNVPLRARNLRELARMRREPMAVLHGQRAGLPERGARKGEGVAVHGVAGEREHLAGDAQEADVVALVPADHL